jgi:hypothetical protein
VLVYAGHPARAIEVVERHMRLDPFYVPLAPYWLGSAHYVLDPQQLGGFCHGLFDVSKLGIGRGQPSLATAQIRGPGNTFPQWGQGLPNCLSPNGR